MTAARTAMTAVALIALGGLIWLLQGGGPVSLSSASIDGETVELPAPEVEASGSVLVAPTAPAATPAGADTGDADRATEPRQPMPPQLATPSAPSAPNAPSPGPRLDLVRVEPDGRAQIAGRAAAGGGVVLRLDGVEVGRAEAGADGSFFALVAIGPSEAPRSLTVEDADGAVAALMVQPAMPPKEVAATPDEATASAETERAASEPSAAAPNAPAAAVVEAAVPDRGDAAAGDGDGTTLAGMPAGTPGPGDAVREMAAGPVTGPDDPEGGQGIAASIADAEGRTVAADPAGPATPFAGTAPPADAAEIALDAAPLDAGVEETASPGLPAEGGPDDGGLTAAAQRTDAIPVEPAPALRPDAARSAGGLPGTPDVASTAPTAPSALDGPPDAAFPVEAVAAVEPPSPADGIETAPAPVPPKVLIADREGVRVLQAPPLDRGLELDTISYSETGAVEVAGRADAAETSAVRVYVDGRPVLETPTAPDGAWNGALADIEAGTYTLRVDALDGDGKVVRRVELPFLRETPDAVAAAGPAIVTVQPGNTLWGIARDTYGDGLLYVRVFEANREAIRNPDLIYPGQIFDVPDSDARRSRPPSRAP